jgi:hypothetical protein
MGTLVAMGYFNRPIIWLTNGETDGLNWEQRKGLQKVLFLFVVLHVGALGLFILGLLWYKKMH